MEQDNKKVIEEQTEKQSEQKAQTQEEHPDTELQPDAPVKEAPSPKKKKQKLLLAGLSAAVIVILAGAYISVAVYYQSHFLPHTVIRGIECSNADSATVVSRLIQRSKEYTLEITGRDAQGNPLTIGAVNAGDIDYTLDDKVEGAVDGKLMEQNEWLWFLRLFDNTSHPVDIFTPVAFDREKLENVLEQIDGLKARNMTEAQDAYISEYSKAANGYEIMPEVLGSQLDMDAVRQAVETAIYDSDVTVDLTDQGCYIEPEITADSPELLANLEKANRWIGTEITYDWNGSEVVVNAEQIQEWITFSKGVPALDEEAVAAFVSGQASQYDTYGKRRNFMTTLGVELSLPSRSYGWLTDRDAETEELMNLIESGTSAEREPVYAIRGAVKGSDDIGSSYVEIDLSNQHLYLYQNGNIVLETDFVSGNMSNGNTTPDGVCGITYKTTNAILRGRDYETPVNYWMPFNGNVGMHDATWRSEFGGDIYLTNGSHGCINLPLDMAAAIYEYMSTGFPVICYYY